MVIDYNIFIVPMYYIIAEAYLELNADSATWYFDQVLASRGLTPLAERTTPETLTQELINLERFKEYFGEGQTFYNLKRQNLPINSWDENQAKEVEIPASNKIYVVPIPDSEYENRL